MQMYGLPLDRVIVATDANPNYIEFWPSVARAWKDIIGLKVTLVLIATPDVYIDESLGDQVIRFEPIEGIPTSFQAQVIRLLIPVLYPDDVCILSDIDMIPLNRGYFVDSIADCPEDSFVVYRNHGYSCNAAWYPMCYVAARGSTYQEIFRIKTLQDIRTMLKELYDLQIGWHTDEVTMAKYLKEWPDFDTRCIMLGHGVDRRLDRSYWVPNQDFLENGIYIDAHCNRPYSAHKESIDAIINLNRSAFKNNRSQ
jgi:hypothetical protein